MGDAACCGFGAVSRLCDGLDRVVVVVVVVDVGGASIATDDVLACMIGCSCIREEEEYDPAVSAESNDKGCFTLCLGKWCWVIKECGPLAVCVRESRNTESLWNGMDKSDAEDEEMDECKCTPVMSETNVGPEKWESECECECASDSECAKGCMHIPIGAVDSCIFRCRVDCANINRLWSKNSPRRIELQERSARCTSEYPLHSMSSVECEESNSGALTSRQKICHICT